MRQKTKRTTALSVGAAVFTSAYLAPPGLLPFSDLTPMLIVVGVAAPAGAAFALWQWFDYVATRHDVRIVRQIQPEPVRRGESLDDLMAAEEVAR